MTMTHNQFTSCLRTVGAIAVCVALAACGDDGPTGPSLNNPPYIAVVARVEAGALPGGNVMFNYRVTDLSEGGTLDTLITLESTDTLILSVRPATYQIELENLPDRCVSRFGTTDVLVVPPGINTAISRFFISCNVPLAVHITTLGGSDDFRFVWELSGMSGTQQTGFVERRDEVVILNPLAPGDYSFSVFHTPTSCEVTSPGGHTQLATVIPAGGLVLQFVVICSEPLNRPEIKKFRWSYADGFAAMYVEAHDPDANLSRYVFDITDCAGRSLLPREIERGQLQSWHTFLQPDPVVIAAFATGPLPQTQHLCATLRLFDDFGNTTPRVERLREPPGALSAQVVAYNAVFAGPTRLVTMLQVQDPSNDYVGAAVALELRDGTLGTHDGVSDIGDYNNQGFLPGTAIPEIEMGPGRRIQSLNDVHTHMVFLVDRDGRFRRLFDNDLFH